MRSDKMKRYTALQLLTIATIYTGVLCSEQTTLQELAFNSSPEISATCNFSSYAAIGDSYSAGLASWYELPICNTTNNQNCTSAQCSRNKGAYGYQFAARAKIPNFQFLACTGATTGNILTLQVPHIDPNTQLVTLTAGGDNDDIFAKIIRNCVYYGSGSCSGWLAIANDTIQTLDKPMISLWNSIKDRAPRAAIYHLGYIKFWPAVISDPNRCQDIPLGGVQPSIITQINNIIVAFNNKVARLASANGVRFVNVDSGFDTHRFCDPFTSWILWRLGFSSKDYHHGVFHPNEDGQHVYRAGLTAALGCTTPKPSDIEDNARVEYEL